MIVANNLRKMSANYILIILTAISFYSYGQIDKAGTDKIVKYFDWTGKIEYLKSPEYNRTTLADYERNRDSILLQNFIAMNYDSVKLYDEFPCQLQDLYYLH